MLTPFTGKMPPSWRAALALFARAGVYLGALFLLFLSYWINRYFGKPDIEQIPYHLNFGVDGLTTADPVLVHRFLRWCVLAPLAVLALLVVGERRLIARAVALGAPRRLAGLLAGWMPPALLAGALVHWALQVSALQYLESGFGPDYFVSYYLAPEKVTLVETHPKNLVLIYVESLEQSYTEGDVFGRDLLAPLTRLEASHFESYEQVPGTGWTIAAMVATQCGVPLKRVSVYDINAQGEKVRSFLPNATCLSDILAAHGYRNVFMGGASTTFAGKGKFLRTHHYQEVYGKEEWLGQGVAASDMNGWGLYDDDLFGKAKLKLRQLQASKQRFNLTLLTVDSHEPEGHLSRGCARRGYTGFDGVISCTAQDLAGFVRFAEDSGSLANTNIVIIGDHLARVNPLSDALAMVPRRTIFNRFISDLPPPKNREQLVHFDLLPTILEFNGFTVPGGRLGLGYSGFYPHRARPPADRFEEMQASLMNRSETYLALWRPRPAPATPHS